MFHQAVTTRRTLFGCGAVCLCAVLGISFGMIWFLGRGASASAAAGSLNSLDAESAVDRLYADVTPTHSKTQVIYPTPPIPPEFRPAAPKSVRMRDEGVYLIINRFFVEEDGVFILKSDTDFHPSSVGDPSYKKVSGRIYTYHISG